MDTFIDGISTRQWGWVPASINGVRVMAGGKIAPHGVADVPEGENPLMVGMDIQCLVVTNKEFFDMIKPPPDMYQVDRDIGDG